MPLPKLLKPAVFANIAAAAPAIAAAVSSAAIAAVANDAFVHTAIAFLDQ
jgi:hypothetical protein